MRAIITLLISSVVAFGAMAQPKTQVLADQLKLEAYEDSLFHIADTMLHGFSGMDRQNAVYQFIPMLVKALKVPGSYDYPFSKLKSLSIVGSPDNKFRIFTWDLRNEDGAYRFYGAIQMNSKDGLKLYPLFDNSSFMPDREDTTLSADEWFGCMYYKIIKNKKFYTLFGWDGNNMISNRKIMEILWFNEEGVPMFGLPVFQMSLDSTKHRYLFEYKKNAGVTVNYDEHKKLIIFDRLVPEQGNDKAKHTFVPDGTYHGFQFEKGNWVFVDKVFNFSIDHPDNPPVPLPRED